MTARQALWMEIAEAFGTPNSEGTRKQRVMSRRGFCHALDIMLPYTGNGDKLYSKIEADIEKMGCFGSHWTPMGDDVDAERCQFALFMAVISDKDYEEMVK